jgi:rod shape-determining protein MreC
VTLPRRARDAIFIGGLLALPVLMLRASARAPTELNAVDRTVLRASAPLQHGLTSVVEAVGTLWRRYLYLVDVKRDNDRLTDENARLRSELSRLRVEAARGDKLERLLGLRSEVPSETVAARVVGVGTSPLFRVVNVRLDRGDAEVKPGMPVLVPEGVVGRVGRVFGRYCDVVLAVDPKSAVDVLLPRTGGRGMLKGLPGDNGYRARIDYLLREEEVREGDEVVTSGVGGVFPRGLPVGKVSRVVRRDFGLYQDAEVAPAVDFTRLDEVLVVLAPPPPPDPDAMPGSHRASEPHRGIGVPR